MKITLYNFKFPFLPNKGHHLSENPGVPSHPHFSSPFHPDFLRNAASDYAGGDFAPTTTAGVLSAAAGGHFGAMAGKKNNAKKKKTAAAARMGGVGVGGAGANGVGGGCLAILSEKDQARKERHRMYMRKWREKRKSEGMPLY